MLTYHDHTCIHTHTRKDTSCVHRGADSVFVGADNSGSHLLHDRYERVGGEGGRELRASLERRSVSVECEYALLHRYGPTAVLSLKPLHTPPVMLHHIKKHNVSNNKHTCMVYLLSIFGFSSQLYHNLYSQLPLSSHNVRMRAARRQQEAAAAQARTNVSATTTLTITMVYDHPHHHHA